MPIYEYQCNQCRCRFETLVLPGDRELPACPACCGQDVRKLISAGSARPHGIPSGGGGFKPPKCVPSKG